MKIHHLRNATLVLEGSKHTILVDPMLGAKGSLPPFTAFRFKAQKNPIVPLPHQAQAILEKVTHCLITHLHPDHLDKAAEQYLIKRNIPVLCSIHDQLNLKKRGLKVVQTISYWEKTTFLDGTIEGIPARHGYGFIAKPMGKVMGYFIELPEEPSIYISADTIYTQAVAKVLKDYQPSLAILACGAAQLDLFQPLLMKMEDILDFIKTAPHKVLANHLEALNHCPMTREALKAKLLEQGLLEKTYIPDDGQYIELV